MNMQVTQVPLKDIYLDEVFNSRDEIQATSVIDLAKSIRKDGLIQPIMIMPYDGDSRETYAFKVVAGHRRYKAHLVLAHDDDKYKEISAIIREGLTEGQARIINLNENLGRKDLNILEEAKALIPLIALGMSEEGMVAEIPTASRGWIQTRCMLLKLPANVQKEAAARLITQTQIRSLYTMKRAGISDELIYEEVKKAKEAKERGDKYLIKNDKVKEKAKRPSELKKHRNRSDMFVMMKHLRDNKMAGPMTRVLAWAAGEVSDLELFLDLKEYADAEGVDYEVSRTEGLDYSIKV